MPPILVLLLVASSTDSDADRLFRAGKYLEASAVYRSLLANEPNSVDALSGLGKSLLEASHAPEAVPYLSRAVQMRPDDVLLKCALAKALLRAGNAPAAIGLLEALATPDIKDAEVPLLLGEAMYRGGYYQRTVQLLEQGLALDPGNTAARQMRAVALAKTGHIEEASIACERILKDRSAAADLDVLLTYVELLAESGRAGEAAQYADRALAEHPSNPVAHFWKARLLLHAGQLDAATIEAEKSVALAPQLPFARNLLVRMYLQLGRAEDAKAQSEWLRQFGDQQSGRGRL